MSKEKASEEGGTMTISKLISRATQAGVTLALTFASLGVLYPDKFSKYGDHAMGFINVYEYFLWGMGSLTIVFAIILFIGTKLKFRPETMEFKVKSGESKSYHEMTSEELKEVAKGIEKFEASSFDFKSKVTGPWMMFFRLMSIPESLAIILILKDTSLAIIFVATQLACLSLIDSMKKIGENTKEILSDVNLHIKKVQQEERTAKALGELVDSVSENYDKKDELVEKWIR